jgi:hypothetical protein
MSVQEVENMTLAQKRMAAMIMENTVEDVEAHRARQAAAEAEAAAAVGGAGVGGGDGDAAMEESDDEDEAIVAKKKGEEEDRRREIERAQAIQASSVNTAGPMKIRTDYVPKREYNTLASSIFLWLIVTHQSVRTRGKRLLQHVRSVVNRFLWMNFRSICVSNSLILAGNPNVMH